MADFQIKRGLSTTMFTSPGVLNPRLIVEEGVWYLCTDTAELYLGVAGEENKATVKKINGQALAELDAELVAAVTDLKNSLTALEELKLYQKIESETDLPTDFTSEDFNPNITYYIPITEDRVTTYIFDEGVQGYLSTNSVDELVIRAMVASAIEENLNETLEAILPEAIKQNIEGAVLYGGDAAL